MKILQQSKIFNPSGNDDTLSRTIWKGDTTNLMNLNQVKYDWALSLYQQMRANFWIPEKVDVTQDIVDYNNLTAPERKAYNGILSYLTFLDSIQSCNLPHVKAPITAPEVSLCLAEQLSQEGMHNHSYQYLIETVIPKEDRAGVYEFWRTDEVLLERCQFIAEIYQRYLDKPYEDNYFITLVADYLLEGLYFYNGFIFFYNLAMRLLMSGTADMFRYINRDELSHVRLFQKIMPEAMVTFNHDVSEIYELFDTAVQQEIKWTNHICDNQILGITEQSTENYTKHLANKRLKAIGLKELYPGATNPYKHLDKFADTGKEANTKVNFFDSTVTSYVQSSGISGWDEI